MIIAIETIILCLFMWLICILSTGNDTKNLKTFDSYPNELKNKLKNDSELNKNIKVSNPLIKFISNFLIFGIILFLAGLLIRTSKFLNNFLYILLIGEIMNLFDFLIVDLIWFRNTKRIRFKNYPQKELYKNPQNHFISFLKGMIMFALIALIDGFLLSLF